jgi:TonB family protein
MTVLGGVSVNGHSINRWLALGFVLMSTPAVARDRSKPAAPAGSPAGWFSDKDYPTDAKRANQEGRVSVRVAVDADGGVSACEVTGSSGSSSLDAKTCELVRTRGKFVPARDASGKPTASSYSLSTRWALQDAPPMKLAGPWRLATMIGIDSAGMNVSCKDERSGPVPVELPMCAAAPRMPTAFGLYARGPAGTTRVVEIVMESSFVLDGGKALPMAYESSARETVSLRKIHFDVDTTGKAQDCRVIVERGPGPSDLCRDPGMFEPSARPRGVTVTMAMSRPANK